MKSHQVQFQSCRLTAATMLMAALLISSTSFSEQKADFCGHYTGTIGDKLQIRMNLCSRPGTEAGKKDRILEGSYFYVSRGTPLSLSGSIGADGTFTLSETGDRDKETGRISGMLAENILNGTWKSVDGKKSFPVRLKEDYTESAAFSTVFVSETHSYKNDSKGPNLNETYFFIEPVKKEGKEAIVAAILSGVFGKRFKKTLGFEGNMKAAIAEDIKNFEMDTAERLSFKGPPDDAPPTPDWGVESYVRPAFNDFDVMVLDVYSTEYSGGAHGSYYDQFLVFDLKTGRRVGMKDIFKGDYEAVLKKLIVKKLEAYFKKALETDYHGLKDVLLDGNMKAVKPNDNFFINKAGVGFHYNIYEITPYALGAFDAFIPFGELKGILNEKGPVAHLYGEKQE